MGRIEREKKTITLMIEIYCRKKHGNKKGVLCDECKELLEYAHKRLDFCKFGNEKSFCSKCPIHCYKKDMKVKIKDVITFLALEDSSRLSNLYIIYDVNISGDTKPIPKDRYVAYKYITLDKMFSPYT